MNEIALNSKNKNTRYLYRDKNEFKRGYQHRQNLVKHEKGDLLADSHNILIQLLKPQRVSWIRHLEFHTAETLGPDPCTFEEEIAICRYHKV
jgi:hypothetical protein